LVDVDKQRDVVLAAPGGGFIDRKPGYARRIGPPPRLVDIVMNDNVPSTDIVSPAVAV
jgi:hypothetical protein